MSAIVTISANITQVQLSGEFDFSSQDELKQVFDEALRAAAPKIQIDMQKTVFIDSSVIRFLLKLHDNARKNKKSLSIINCNERIYEIFTIGGFDQVFDIQ